jgi:hypothetical protein
MCFALYRLACSLLTELRIVGQKRFHRPVCDRVFRLSDPAKKDPSEIACGSVVQTKVRAIFHHIQGVAAFR